MKESIKNQKIVLTIILLSVVLLSAAPGVVACPDGYDRACELAKTLNATGAEKVSDLWDQPEWEEYSAIVNNRYCKSEVDAMKSAQETANRQADAIYEQMDQDCPDPRTGREPCDPRIAEQYSEEASAVYESDAYLGAREALSACMDRAHKVFGLHVGG